VQRAEGLFLDKLKAAPVLKKGETTHERKIKLCGANETGRQQGGFCFFFHAASGSVLAGGNIHLSFLLAFPIYFL